MDKAVIFNIQRFSLHDGPGIRTLVFFKGCSLACDWCSNPEGINPEIQIRNNKTLCIGCGRCLQCPTDATKLTEAGVVIDREKCVKCGKCVDSCPTRAMSWWGEEISIEKLFARIKKDSVFFKHAGGGVTLGGGDPVLQINQAEALLKLCKAENINTAIETAGNYSWDNLEKIIPYCDTIHFDLKSDNSKLHKLRTGTSNKLIISNLLRLDQWISEHDHKPKLIVRLPMLPGYNFTLENFITGIDILLALKNISLVEILPFHNLGGYKYGHLNYSYKLESKPNVKDEEVYDYYNMLEMAGLPVKLSSL